MDGIILKFKWNSHKNCLKFQKLSEILLTIQLKIAWNSP